MQYLMKEEDLKKVGVYVITNIKNNKKYIGCCIGSFRGRLNGHKRSLRKGIHNNTYLQRAWNKYGEENFNVDIVEIIEIKDKKLIQDREAFYIEKYKTAKRQFGYNMIDYHDGVALHSQESKDKMSAAAQKNYENNLLLYGKGCSPETSQKISKSSKGKKFSKEHKQKIAIATSKARKGTKLSEEHKLNISKGVSGVNNPRYGKKKSEEEKRKQSESLKKKSKEISERVKSNWTLEKRFFMSHKNGVMLEEKDYLEIKNCLIKMMGKDTLKNISEILGKQFKVNSHIITSIKNGKHWSNDYLLNGGYKEWI